MTGFYGKLPTKGDFLSRSLPRDFVDSWDSWLQTGMNDSRQALGDEWLQIYLTSPLWRFVLPAGIIGESAWGGVLMPSMDRVGRYFPMTVAEKLPADTVPILFAANGGPWFESVETYLLEALDQEALDVDTFDEGLSAIAPAPPNEQATVTPGSLGSGVRVSLDDDLNIGEALLGLTAAMLADATSASSVWWGHGSDRIPPSLAFCAGLPGAGKFTALLDGKWSGHGWQEQVPRGLDPLAILSGTAAV